MNKIIGCFRALKVCTLPSGTIKANSQEEGFQLGSYGPSFQRAWSHPSLCDNMLMTFLCSYEHQINFPRPCLKDGHGLQ